MWNQIKTVLLLGLLSGLVLAIGFLLGGQTGLAFALVFAVLMNFGMFFFSHKLVLAMYRAVPAGKEHSRLQMMVNDLARKMHLPKPALYIIPTKTPNAFATGPSPSKAVVACTEGILEILSEDELKGVIAHELSHIKNRDMLIATMAATLAAVISYVAMFARFAMIFGGNDRDNNAGNLIAALALVILAPIIALILQLAISRSREFLADATGAKVLHTGVPLANALKKLETACHHHPLRNGSPATASLFIVNPFSMKGLVSLFSTHPSTDARVERLLKMKF